MWSWDRAAGTVRWDRRHEDIFGLTPHTFGGTFEAWMALVEPEDRDTLIETLTARRAPTTAASPQRFGVEYRCIWPDGSSHRVETRGALLVDDAAEVVSGVGVSLDVARRYHTGGAEGAGAAAERTARDDAEAAWRRLARLQDLAVALAAASTVDEVAEVLIERGIAALRADGGFFSIVNRQRGVISLRVARSTPRRILDRCRTVPVDSGNPLGQAAQTGRSVFVTSEDDRRATFPGLELEGAAAFVVTPVLNGDVVTAVLVFGFAEAHVFHAADRELIATIAGMSADAVRRAQLHDAGRRAARRSSQLERAAARLAGAGTAGEVGEILAEELAPMVGAAVASLYLVDEGAGALRAVALPGCPPELVDANQMLPLTELNPITAAFRAAEPVMVDLAMDWRSRFPALGPIARAPGIEAVYQMPLVTGEVVLGTLGFGFDDVTLLDDALRQHLGIIATICGQALARAIALSDAQRASTRLAAVDEITDAALSQLALEDLLQELPRRVAASIGCDTVRIMLLDAAGETLRDHGRFGTDQPSVDVPFGRGLAGRVAETGVPLVFEDLSHEEVVRPSLPIHITNVAGFPLTSRGRVIGVLDVGAGPDRPFTDDDIELLGLAGDRIATAIERSRAFEIERTARERADLMSRLGEIVSGGGSVVSMATNLVRVCAGALADWCVLTVVSDSGSAVDAAAHVDPSLEGVVRALTEAIPFDAASASGAGAVVRTGDIEMMPPGALGPEEDPQVRRLLDRLGQGSQLMVPLIGTSRIVGVLRLGRTGGSFPPSDVALTREVAARIGVAVESRLSHERHRDAVMTLQRSLLPGALPPFDGLEVATGYWPASDEFEVGGDFFDVIGLAPGRWGVLIGDISGKGIQGAAMTGIARQTARVAARHGLEPDQVLGWIHDAFLTQRETIGNHCSAIYGILELLDEGARFRFAVGGHPLPIVRPEGGGARYAGTAGTVLGLIDPIVVTVSEVILSPGDWLVLYTDGVTDVPTPDAIDDDELLHLIDKSCVDSPTPALASLEKMLKERYEGVASRDDTALVVIRCTGGRRLPADAGNRGGDR